MKLLKRGPELRGVREPIRPGPGGGEKKKTSAKGPVTSGEGKTQGRMVRENFSDRRTYKKGLAGRGKKFFPESRRQIARPLESFNMGPGLKRRGEKEDSVEKEEPSHWKNR